MSIEKNLDSNGICSIIKSCADSGVTYFELGDLKIGFGKKPKKVVIDPDWLKPDSDHEQDLEEEIPVITEEIPETKEDEQERIAQELAFLQQEHPHEWEEMLANDQSLLEQFGKDIGLEPDDGEDSDEN